ncbi:hypothetical protein ACOMHN_014014 [Nucella lapillus]
MDDDHHEGAAPRACSQQVDQVMDDDHREGAAPRACSQQVDQVMDDDHHEGAAPRACSQQVDQDHVMDHLKTATHRNDDEEDDNDDEAAWVSHGNSMVEVDHIMDQLKTAAHLPCVVTMDMEAISQPVRFSFEASLTDSIGQHGKISTSPAHQMVTLSVPGPDAPKPPPEELPSVTLPDLDADSMDTESVSDSASVIVEDAAGLPAYTLTEAELGNNRVLRDNFVQSRQLAYVTTDSG